MYRIAMDDPRAKIAAGGYATFNETDFNPTPELPGPYDFALNGAHGDDVWLMKADEPGKITHFGDHVDVGAQANSHSWGRWPNGTGILYPTAETTLDDDNSGPRLASVILSEVHYNPGLMTNADELEFVEIHNTTGSPVDLAHWRLDGGIDFEFAVGTTLAAGGTLVIVPFDPVGQPDLLAAFEAHHGVQGSIDVVGPYDKRLDDDGERVQLLYADEPPATEPNYYPGLLEDEVVYDDDAPWPETADGDGPSINRLDAGVWGNEPTNWAGQSPSPGAASVTTATQVVGRHVFYNNSAFDGSDPADDDQAIASDKTALMPGDTATFDNYTSYSRGINGIMVDLASLPDGVTPTAADFQFRFGNDNMPGDWDLVTTTPTVTVRDSEGAGGSDRVTITWPDGLLRNGWLQVTVLSTANCPLPTADIFYFGNAVAESGNATDNARVTTTDLLLARNNPRVLLDGTDLDFPYDFNRDKAVNATDVLLARNNQTNFLNAVRLIHPLAAEESPSQSSQSLWSDWLELAWLAELQAADDAQGDAVDTVDAVLATLEQ